MIRTEQAFDIEFIRRLRTLEREVSRLAAKDPGAGVITGLTLDHINVGAGSGATTGQIHASGHIQTTSQFISTLVTGTAPLVVSSTTVVTNLNSDLLDGLHAATSGNDAHVVSTDVNGDTTYHRLTLTQAIGTAPMTITSTTKVANLNADLLDDLSTATSGVSAHVVITDVNGSTTISGVLTTPEIKAAANLTIDPTGDIIVTPGGNDVLPGTAYTINLGALSTKFLTLHAAELWVETLVAQSTMATIGGRILVGTTTVLTSDVTVGAGSITVKHNSLANGDFVILEANGSFEVMKITSVASGGGPYTYNVTRNVDTSGANAWSAGDAVFDTKNAFIDLYSVSGVRSASQAGPTVVGNIRTAAVNWNDLVESWAIGNLDHLYDYGSTTYGCAFGRYAAGQSWISMDATNGIRIMYGVAPATKLAQWDTSGNILIGEEAASHSNVKITAGSVLIRNNTTAVITLLATANAAGQIATFDGVIGITASGGIWQGSVGTFASPNTGLKIYQSGSKGIWEAWFGGSKQVYIDAATMALRAGPTRLDPVGVSLFGSGLFFMNNDGSLTYGYADVSTADFNSGIGLKITENGANANAVEIQVGADPHFSAISMMGWAAGAQSSIDLRVGPLAAPSPRILMNEAGITVTGTLTLPSFSSAGRITLTIATGTSPFVITSTTVNTNLNADMTDGLHAATSGSNAHLVATDANGDTSLRRLTSTIATGTSPFVVSSTTVVTNLNADLLDGLSQATSGSNAHVVATDANGDTSLRRLTSTIATGTSPFVVSSTTVVTNLNADLLDGYNTAASGANAHVLLTDSLGGITLNGGLAWNTTGQRITGDFSNATHGSRILWQTSTAGGQTNMGLIPNAASAATAYFAYNSNDPDNSEFVQFYCTATIAALSTNARGTGSTLPLLIQVSGTEFSRWTVVPSGTAGVFRMTYTNAGSTVAAFGVMNYNAPGSGTGIATLAKLPGSANGKANEAWIRFEVNGTAYAFPAWAI